MRSLTSAPDLPPIRELLERHGIWAKKSLGQNFLLDLNITRKIARNANLPEHATVLEVGPGPGGLTRAILEQKPQSLTVIEKDRDFLPLLEMLKEHYSQLHILRADALKVDMAALGEGAPLHIISNLPYNVGTPLLVSWVERAEHVAGMTLMFQKEVAERILAKPGTAAYGRLAVLCQWRCEAWRCFDVPPEAFTPRPKIVSTVVHLKPRPEPLYPAPMKALQTVLQHSFGQRRKMLKASLKSLFANASATLEATGIDPTLRPEQLDIGGFCTLARAYAEQSSRT